VDLNATVGAPAQTQTRSPGDDRWYAPDRDLAYVGPELIRRAFLQVSLDKLRHDASYTEMLKGVPEDELLGYLGDAAKALANGVNVCHRGSPDGPAAAFVEFAALPSPAPQIFLMRLGEMLLGAIFTALQDVTPVDSSPPHARSLQSLVESAAKVSDQLAITNK